MRTKITRINQIAKEKPKICGLEFAENKTRLIKFGKYAIEDRRIRGKGKPDTFQKKSKHIFYLTNKHYNTKSHVRRIFMHGSNRVTQGDLCFYLINIKNKK